MSQPFEAANPVSPPVKPNLRRFQVSIKTLIVATAMFAVILAFMMQPAIAAFTLMLAHAILVGLSIIASISGRGWIRPFAIVLGTYLIVLGFVQMNLPHSGPAEFAVVEIINLVLASICAFAGAAFQSFLARRDGFIPVPNLPFLKHWLVNKVNID